MLTAQRRKLVTNLVLSCLCSRSGSSFSGSSVLTKLRSKIWCGNIKVNLRLLHRVSSGCLFNLGGFCSGLCGCLGGRCVILGSLLRGWSLSFFLFLLLLGRFGSLGLLVLEGSKKLGKKTGTLRPIFLLSLTLDLRRKL